jgi:hypothetical protein
VLTSGGGLERAGLGDESERLGERGVNAHARILDEAQLQEMKRSSLALDAVRT